MTNHEIKIAVAEGGGSPTMKALSLWQPWASAIAAGLKTIETRAWKTSYRGPLLIHAAKRWDDEQQLLDRHFREVFPEYAARMPAQFPRGCLIAQCTLDDVVETIGHHPDPLENELGDFSLGRFAWRLSNVKPLNPPVKWPGAMGLFDVQLPNPHP